MNRKEQQPEILYKDPGVTIIRLDEACVELRTTPGWREYFMMAFVLAICAVLFFGLVIGFFSTVNWSDGPPASLILGGIGVVLLTGLVLTGVWLALYHTLPKSFLTDTKSSKCIHTYCKFFRREISFEDVEYTEEYSNQNGIGFYLKEKGKLWRTCIFFANAFTKSMDAPEAAVRIFTREFEKAGITFPERREGFFTRMRAKIAVVFWMSVIAAGVGGPAVLPVVDLAVETVDIVQGSSTTTGTVLKTMEETQKKERSAFAYTYTVDGRQYESERVLPRSLSGSGSGQWAEFLEDIHTRGESVTVYYNPAAPEKAHIIHGWGIGVVVITFFIWGILLIMFAVWRKEKKRRRMLITLSLGPAMLIYGIGAGIVAATVGGIDATAVRVSVIHWHALVFTILFVSSLAYQASRKKAKFDPAKAQH